MRLILAAGLLIAGVAWLSTMPTPANADTSRPAICLLQVHGIVIMHRVCKFEESKDGSFTIGVDERKLTYFAYVNMNPDGTATGSWNGLERESHAQEDLGVLHREDACWVNGDTKVCAW